MGSPDETTLPDALGLRVRLKGWLIERSQRQAQQPDQDQTDDDKTSHDSSDDQNQSETQVSGEDGHDRDGEKKTQPHSLKVEHAHSDSNMMKEDMPNNDRASKISPAVPIEAQDQTLEDLTAPTRPPSLLADDIDERRIRFQDLLFEARELSRESQIRQAEAGELFQKSQKRMAEAGQLHMYSLEHLGRAADLLFPKSLQPSRE